MKVKLKTKRLVFFSKEKTWDDAVLFYKGNSVVVSKYTVLGAETKTESVVYSLDDVIAIEEVTTS